MYQNKGRGETQGIDPNPPFQSPLAGWQLEVTDELFIVVVGMWGA